MAKLLILLTLIVSAAVAASAQVISPQTQHRTTDAAAWAQGCCGPIESLSPRVDVHYVESAQDFSQFSSNLDAAAPWSGGTAGFESSGFIHAIATQNSDFGINEINAIGLAMGGYSDNRSFQADGRGSAQSAFACTFLLSEPTFLRIVGSLAVAVPPGYGFGVAELHLQGPSFTFDKVIDGNGSLHWHENPILEAPAGLYTLSIVATANAVSLLNYEPSASYAISLIPIPEPAGLWSLGALLVIFVRRRGRN